MEAPPRTNLFKKLLAAQKATKAVTKDSTNSYMRYKYASAEAMVEEAKRCLNESGLVLTLVKKYVRASVNGGTELVQELLLADPDTGETLPMETAMAVVIDKGKPADKSEAATATFDLGYFLRSVVLLSREDPETAVDARDDRNVPDQNKLIEELKAAIVAAKTRDDLVSVRERANQHGVVPAIKEPFTAKFQALSA